MEKDMQPAMQMIQQTRCASTATKLRNAQPDTLDLLEQFGITVTIQRGHEVYGQGQPTEFCWRIFSGCVRTVKLLEDGRRLIGAFLWPGDLFGIDDLSVHNFGTEAVTDVTLRRYPRRTVEALAQSHTALALRLRVLMAADLQHAHRQMMLLGRKTIIERVASFLLDMDRRSTTTDRRTMDVPMSRADIADYLGTTTETVSRAIARLRHDGTLAVLRSGFEFRDRVALTELAHESLD
jgi:CRP/FNR family transcriptional regulator, nitrogen fixation regulation protein